MKSAHIVLYLLLVGTLEGAMLGYLYVKSAPPRHNHAPTLIAQRSIQRGGSFSVSLFSGIGSFLAFICKKLAELLMLMRSGLIEAIEVLCHAIMIAYESLPDGMSLYVKHGYQATKDTMHG